MRPPTAMPTLVANGRSHSIPTTPQKTTWVLVRCDNTEMLHTTILNLLNNEQCNFRVTDDLDLLLHSPSKFDQSFLGLHKHNNNAASVQNGMNGTGSVHHNHQNGHNSRSVQDGHAQDEDDDDEPTEELDSEESDPDDLDQESSDDGGHEDNESDNKLSDSNMEYNTEVSAGEMDEQDEDEVSDEPNHQRTSFFSIRRKRRQTPMVQVRCKVCNKEISVKGRDWHARSAHAIIHSELDRYQCPKCDFKNKHRSEVSRHIMRMRHQSTKNIQDCMTDEDRAALRKMVEICFGDEDPPLPRNASQSPVEGTFHAKQEEDDLPDEEIMSKKQFTPEGLLCRDQIENPQPRATPPSRESPHLEQDDIPAKKTILRAHISTDPFEREVFAQEAKMKKLLSQLDENRRRKLEAAIEAACKGDLERAKAIPEVTIEDSVHNKGAVLKIEIKKEETWENPTSSSAPSSSAVPSASTLLSTSSAASTSTTLPTATASSTSITSPTTTTPSRRSTRRVIKKRPFDEAYNSDEDKKSR